MPLISILPSPVTVLKVIASTASLLAVGAGTALYLYQSRLIYPANLPAGSRTNVPTPSDFGIDPYQDLDLTTPDGVRIKAYLMLYQHEDGVPPSSRPTVLLLHANAGNVGHRLPIAKVFWHKMRCNVLALSYRGYGHSEGSPSEKGLKLDSQTALDYILSHPQLEKTDVFLYGQSIGGAVAVHLASQNAQRVKGLIVENTFRSLPKLIPHLMPYLTPFLPLLLNQIWPSETYIATLPKDFPVLFLAGAKDELVVPGQMTDLYVLCGSSNKVWREFENGTHNDTCAQPLYFHHIAQFIASVCGLPLTLSDASPFAPSTQARAPPAASTPRTDPISTSTFPSSSSATRPDSPISPTKSSTSSGEESSGSGESFELIDVLEKETNQRVSAGSMGPKEELEEVGREVEEKVQELAEKGGSAREVRGRSDL
ncbi:hypothetical protein JCM11641_005222 [Rhodosporidiobolus odoratus]